MGSVHARRGWKYENTTDCRRLLTMIGSLKVAALAVPLLVFYFLDRPIAHLANDLTDATFETGVLVMVLDAIVFVVLGGLSIYVAIKIWNRPG